MMSFEESSPEAHGVPGVASYARHEELSLSPRAHTSRSHGTQHPPGLARHLPFTELSCGLTESTADLPPQKGGHCKRADELPQDVAINQVFTTVFTLSKCCRRNWFQPVTVTDISAVEKIEVCKAYTL